MVMRVGVEQREVEVLPPPGTLADGLAVDRSPGLGL
jgi:hypothetical protein